MAKYASRLTKTKENRKNNRKKCCFFSCFLCFCRFLRERFSVFIRFDTHSFPSPITPNCSQKLINSNYLSDWKNFPRTLMIIHTLPFQPQGDNKKNKKHYHRAVPTMGESQGKVAFRRILNGERSETIFKHCQYLYFFGE